MTKYPEFTLAAIQAAPVFLNREASTAKACELIVEAAQKGATFAAFGETWLPGYPIFATSSLQSPLWNQAAAEYLASAVEIPSPTTDRLCIAARRAGIDVAIGIVELDAKTRGTVYCTLLFIGREGNILGRHRKLKPTKWERMVWGDGDGTGLEVYDRHFGRISGLNCWEHAMVLPGYALMAQGTQIHVATWPTTRALGESHLAGGLLLSRAFALQGSCYVIAPGYPVGPDELPERYRDFARPDWTDYKDQSGSRIIAPGGEVIAEAPAGEETILTASGSLEAVHQAKCNVDVAGHYSRPDVLQLHVDSRPFPRLFKSDSASRSVVPADANADSLDVEDDASRDVQNKG